MKKPSANAPCPCGSGRNYKGCCLKVHEGAPAGSPEALMRSRYAAYAIGHVAHLFRTTHPGGPHWREDTAPWREELARYCEAVAFEGLTVLKASEAGDEGHVTFHASMSQADDDLSFAENSRFLRVDGRWLYHSGDRV